MIFEFNGDEMVLVIIGVVRRVNPTMLKDDRDGVSVDFTPLAGETNLSTDELLLMKLRTASEAAQRKSISQNPKPALWESLLSASNRCKLGRRMS